MSDLASYARPLKRAATSSCPLCTNDQVRVLLVDNAKTYWRCERCHLTFLDPAFHPDRDSEYAHYLTHNNTVSDEGYRCFLNRIAVPLLERITPGSSGLDYGCGPGPALAHMLREAGHRVALYDPFFVPDEAALDTVYDFITCTETAEHFHQPAAQFNRLDKLLKPGGTLALMTCFQDDDDRFARWHYRLDPTHVVFYRGETLAYLGKQMNWTYESPAKDIAFFRKAPQITAVK